MLIIQGLLYYGNHPIIREIAVLFYNTTFPKGSYTLLFHYWFFLYSLSTHLPSYLAVELLEHVGEAEDECLSYEE